MFSHLVGNENIKHTLKRLIRNHRVPNSLLLAGDEGIGKRQFALELAKSLICLEAADGESCGVCSACTRAGKFIFPKSEDKESHKRLIFSDHPDVAMVIPFNRNILVAAVRHLESEANFRPYEASARFLMVDNAEKMNDAASNALLKTLEEPPSTSHIFLITSRPDSLLPTIRSRCQTLRFAPVNDDEIEKYLISERAFTADEARLAARLSRGSIGQALTINVEQFRIRRERMSSVVSNLIQNGGVAGLLRASEELQEAKNKESFEENLDVLQSLIHDIWTIKTSGTAERIVNTDLSAKLSSLAEGVASRDLPAWLGAIDEMRENFIVNINRKVATDALFVSMAAQ